MKKVLVLSLLLASGSALAEQNKITLAGGIVNPNEKLVISLDQLPEKVHYTVKCSLNTTAPMSSTLLDFHVNADGGAHAQPATLNGEEYKSEQALLNPTTDNMLAISDLSSFGKGNALVFANHSTEYSYTVNYCEATQIGSNSASEQSDASSNTNETSTNNDTSNNASDANNASNDTSANDEASKNDSDANNASNDTSANDEASKNNSNANNASNDTSANDEASKNDSDANNASNDTRTNDDTSNDTSVTNEASEDSNTNENANTVDTTSDHQEATATNDAA